MNRNIVILVFTLLFISCNETKKDAITSPIPENNIEKIASFKSIEVEIEGMTCEIGCARTIQSKLSKVDGISYSKVNFETKKGQFTYDENKISETTIISKINGIAGGDLYSVKSVKPIQEIKTDSIF
jgi:Cu+-exporting ATPase